MHEAAVSRAWKSQEAGGVEGSGGYGPGAREGGASQDHPTKAPAWRLVGACLPATGAELSLEASGAFRRTQWV